MEWLLLCFLAAFMLLASSIKSRIAKWSDNGPMRAMGIHDPGLTKYLSRISEEAALRAEPIHPPEWCEDRGTERGWYVDHLDRPGRWEKELRSSKERFFLVFSQALFVAYVMLLMAFLSAVLPDGLLHVLGCEGLQGWAPGLASLSLVAVLYWRHKRSFSDGSLQGYLNGYMDASEASFRAASTPASPQE